MFFEGKLWSMTFWELYLYICQFKIQNCFKPFGPIYFRKVFSENRPEIILQFMKGFVSFKVFFPQKIIKNQKLFFCCVFIILQGPTASSGSSVQCCKLLHMGAAGGQQQSHYFAYGEVMQWSNWGLIMNFIWCFVGGGRIEF